MNIHDIPESFADFEKIMDEYERQFFAFTEGGRAVSDATLGLLNTWYPGPFGRLMRVVSVCLMDEPLREALAYPPPNPLLSVAVRSGLRLRGRLERLLPARRKPFHARMSRTVRSYPDGYDVSSLGT
jgi:hypothetical protein